MTPYADALFQAAESLAGGRGLTYRERLQLERAVFRIIAEHAMREFGWSLRSMAVSAHDQFFAYCEASEVAVDDPRLVVISRGFAVTRLIASIANADPYLLNENVSRIIHRYSTGVATLPSKLRELAAAHSLSNNEGGPNEAATRSHPQVISTELV